jgi:hypothetical protein
VHKLGHVAGSLDLRGDRVYVPHAVQDGDQTAEMGVPDRRHPRRSTDEEVATNGELLNELGQEGWELVSSADRRAHLKREAEPTPAAKTGEAEPEA